LKPAIEAKAKANQSKAGRDKSGNGAPCTIRDEALLSKVDTRQELANSVGLGRNTISKIMQIDENAPDEIKQALDNRELSVNRGYELTKQLADIPEAEREKAAAEALEFERAKKTLAKQNAEIDRKSKIASQFCKAFEKAILLDVTSENVRIWTNCCRMRDNEIFDSAKEAEEIAESFIKIAKIIREEILPANYVKPDTLWNDFVDDNEVGEVSAI